MTQYKEIRADNLTKHLLERYQDGTIAAYILSDVKTDLVKLLTQTEKETVCSEQGSIAELRRLKEYLGEYLSSDWETKRTDKLFSKE